MLSRNNKNNIFSTIFRNDHFLGLISFYFPPNALKNLLVFLSLKISKSKKMIPRSVT